MERDELVERLGRLGAGRLARELADLADRRPGLRRRLETLICAVEVDEVAAALGGEIDDLRADRAPVPPAGHGALATRLHDLLDGIETRVLPHAPRRAFELADAFLATDRTVMPRIEGNASPVLEAYQRACRVWLVAAAQSDDAGDWPGRLIRTAVDDPHGLRENLLREAGLLLPREELRALATRLESRLRDARRPERVESPGAAGRSRATPAARDEAGGLAHALGLVADALEDSSVFERAMELAPGEIDGATRREVARRHLDADQPERAAALLRKAGDTASPEHWRLLATCYEETGDTRRRIDCLWRLFEAAPDLAVVHEIEDLVPARRRRVRLDARDRALASPHLLPALLFLVRAGLGDDADQMATAHHDDLAGGPRDGLAALAAAARDAGRHRLEALARRRLLVDLLEGGRSRTYAEAADHLQRLVEIDRAVADYGSVVPHGDFVDRLRQRHGRKWAFWSRVEG